MMIRFIVNKLTLNQKWHEGILLNKMNININIQLSLKHCYN